MWENTRKVEIVVIEYKLTSEGSLKEKNTMASHPPMQSQSCIMLLTDNHDSHVQWDENSSIMAKRFMKKMLWMHFSNRIAQFCNLVNIYRGQQGRQNKHLELPPIIKPFFYLFVLYMFHVCKGLKELVPR